MRERTRGEWETEEGSVGEAASHKNRDNICVYVKGGKK